MNGWDESIDSWSAFCRSAGHSERSIYHRSYVLRAFAGDVGAEPFAVTAADVVRWLGRPGLTPEGRKFYAGALRSFYRAAVELELTDVDPTARLPRVRIPKTEPRPTPDDVFGAALARATDRDRLVLMLGAYAGLRIGEIAGLRWQDVVDGRALRVRGKGGRVRIVPAHQDLAGELAAEHARRAAGLFGSGYRYAGEGAAGPWLFPGPRGGPMLPDGLGRAARKALGGAAGAHSLRHRFAQRAIDGTGNLLAVQALLGHASVATTARFYVRASAAALTEAVAAAG